MSASATALSKVRIFIASSYELVEERLALELWLHRKNKEWVDQGIFLQVEIWEDFIDAMSPTRLQDEYNKVIEQCDLFLMLYWTKVGIYTAEEFGKAFTSFKQDKAPLIYTFEKQVPPPRMPSVEDVQSLDDFKSKLKALCHFTTAFQNKEELVLRVSVQLDKLRAKGLLPPSQRNSAAASTSARAASGAVSIGGSNSGLANTGTVNIHGAAFFGQVQAGRDVIGGNKTSGD